MYKRDYRDIISGGVLFGVGAFAAIYAYLNYQMGTPRHMGPGWFPFYLGLIMAGIGLIVALSALSREGSLGKFEFKSLIMVCGATLAFALAIRPLGLVPAIFAISIIVWLFDDRYGWKLSLISAVLMSLGAVLIFIYGLGMPLQIVNWRLFG